MNQSLRLAKHLRNRRVTDVGWIKALDQLFLSSAYEAPEGSAFLIGPDQLLYLGFTLARSHDVSHMNFNEALQNALHWAAGGVIYPGAGIPEWVYSPGDIVSLATVATSQFRWQGAWGLDPIVEDYQQGVSISIGSPNPEFLPPLAARSLEVILRKVYQAEEGLRDRTPGIAVLRPANRTRPEDASELTINAFPADFSDPKAWESFDILIRRYLPSHLSRRLLNFTNPVIPLDRFFPLEEILATSGMKPVGEPDFGLGQ